MHKNFVHTLAVWRTGLHAGWAGCLQGSRQDRVQQRLQEQISLVFTISRQKKCEDHPAVECESAPTLQLIRAERSSDGSSPLPLHPLRPAPRGGRGKRGGRSSRVLLPPAGLCGNLTLFYEPFGLAVSRFSTWWPRFLKLNPDWDTGSLTPKCSATRI